MGNTVASGKGESLEVGKNCEKISTFTSNIVLTPKTFFTSKIAYNNSKFGKACLAGTQEYNVIILAQNKNFNFKWEIVEDEDSGELFIIGNHTKKCEKNSLAIFEVMAIEPAVLQANHAKFTEVARKFKSSSELAAQIKKLMK
jgi:hypothetical protein